MSSHHFVKEGQEPALLIADPINFEQVQALLEWSPLIMVLESALEKTLPWGIKADIIIVQPTSFDRVKEVTDHQMPVRLAVNTTSSNQLAYGLQFLIDNFHHHVNVCVGNREGYFETVQKFSDRIEVTLFEGKMKWSCIKTGKFRKWLPKDAIIEVRANQVYRITEGNVKTSETEVVLSADSFLTIESVSNFWVGEASE
jgi:hypothetical protein